MFGGGWFPELPSSRKQVLAQAQGKGDLWSLAFVFVRSEHDGSLHRGGLGFKLGRVPCLQSQDTQQMPLHEIRRRSHVGFASFLARCKLICVDRSNITDTELDKASY